MSHKTQAARLAAQREFTGFQGTGAELARNPAASEEFAIFVRRFLNVFKADNIEIKVGANPRKFKEPLGQFEVDFFREEERLRQLFVNSEVTRIFGPQTGTQTTAGGSPIPGQTPITIPTPQQIADIGKRFLSPTDRLATGIPGTGPQAPPGEPGGLPSRESVLRTPTSVLRTPTPTGVSGAGVRRRRTRRRGAGAEGTILSGASSLGGATLLG